MSRYEMYDEEGERQGEFCARCGEGVFMADHGDRLSCGRCGYTEFRKEDSNSNSGS